MNETPSRVLIIGLDSATFDLIEPWAAQGYLPNLSRLMAEGARSRLASTLQPTTAPAWTTFMTGLNQGQHGLYDFVRRRAGSYGIEVTNSTHVHAPLLFEVVSRLGKQVISVNMPYTFPPRAVNGVMVGGPFAPAFLRETVYPPEMFDSLKSLVPDYFILAEYDPNAAEPLAAYRQALLKEVELRETVTTHLMHTQPWDVCAVVTMATDEVQHTYWQCMSAVDGDPLAKYRDTIRDVYQRIDQLIGNLIEVAAHDGTGRDTAVIILSDHGAGPLGRMININQWLAENHYLTFQTQGLGAVKNMRALSMKRLMYAYKRVIPATVRTTIRARLGARRFHRLKGEFESALATSVVDWSTTQAYSLGAGGNIYINLVGREPHGIVESGGEYENLRDRIAEQFAQLRDPDTGALLVERVHKREDIYHGTQLGFAPDLIVEWRDHSCWGRGLYGNQTPVFEVHRKFDFSDQPQTGTHRPDGILILQGSHVRSGMIFEGARLVDLVPTILALLDLPVPQGLDGMVLQAALTTHVTAETITAIDAGEVDNEHVYTAEEAEKIMQHLQDLGYF